MVQFFPFRAYRPSAEHAASVAAVPYDVVSRSEAQALALTERSFLHVTKPEIDAPDGADPYDLAIYEAGATALRKFVAEGWLQRGEASAYHLYALTMDGRTQTGFVGLASVTDYRANTVRKHEHTREDKETDRTRHMKIMGAQSGTVFLAHAPTEVLSRCAQDAMRAPAEIDFVAADGIRHQVWTLSRPEQRATVQGAFAEMNAVYIADGHHRSAAAARVAESHPSGLPSAEVTPDERPDAGFLTVSFPSDELFILPYNRVVDDLNGLSSDAFLSAVDAVFERTAGHPGTEMQRHQFGMYFEGQWHTLTAKNVDESDPVQCLDVSVLQSRLLGPVLGIDNPRTNTRIQFVGGIRGDGELEARVQAGAKVAFRMFPTSMQELMAVAEAGFVMPPKSTWFEPKLRDGLFVHALENLGPGA